MTLSCFSLFEFVRAGVLSVRLGERRARSCAGADNLFSRFLSPRQNGHAGEVVTLFDSASGSRRALALAKLTPALSPLKTQTQTRKLRPEKNRTTHSMNELIQNPQEVFRAFASKRDKSHVISLCKGHAYLAGRGWEAGTGYLHTNGEPTQCCVCSGFAEGRMKNAPLRECEVAK